MYSAVTEGGKVRSGYLQPEEAHMTETGHDITSGSSQRQVGQHLKSNYKAGLRGTDREMSPLGI
jgi:hypothetical protein